MRNIKLVLEYLGTNYHGFQKQPGLITIQSELERVLFLLLREKVSIVAAGRTDAGVHAKEQVASFKTSSAIDLGRLQWSANALLPVDIVVTDTEEVDSSFNARWSAVSREYTYFLLNRSHPSAFQAAWTYFFARPLDVGAMGEALQYLEGEHDFSAFTSSSPRKHYIRNVFSAKCKREKDLILVRMEANSFLHNMVRIIVGTLLQIGMGKRLPAEMNKILKSKNRNQAGSTVPSRGLVLTGVKYIK